MSSHLTPVQVVECLIAPISELGAITGCGAKTPFGWRRESNYRDAGDMPPRVNRRLLAYAAKHRRPLTAEHLIWGAPHDEIEALLASEGRKMPHHLQLLTRPVPRAMVGHIAAEVAAE